MLFAAAAARESECGARQRCFAERGESLNCAFCCVHRNSVARVVAARSRDSRRCISPCGISPRREAAHVESARALAAALGAGRGAAAERGARAAGARLQLSLLFCRAARGIVCRWEVNLFCCGNRRRQKRNKNKKENNKFDLIFLFFNNKFDVWL